MQDLHVIVQTDMIQLRLFSSVKEGERKDIISHEDRDRSWLLCTGSFGRTLVKNNC